MQLKTVQGYYTAGEQRQRVARLIRETRLAIPFGMGRMTRRETVYMIVGESLTNEALRGALPPQFAELGLIVQRRGGDFADARRLPNGTLPQRRLPVTLR